MEKQHAILEYLPLLKQLPDDELEQFTQAYKAILTLAKIVLPFLLVAIVILLVFRSIEPSSFRIFDPEVIAYIALLCAGWFLIFVPIAFYKIYSLRSKVYRKGEQMGVDKDKLLDEFIIYLHATIRNHYGVNLK